MSWLKAVSALALRVRGLLVTVRPMQAAGPAPLEHTAPHGNKPSALHTNHQRQPALIPQSPNSDHAPSTSTGQKLGNEKQTALAEQVLTVAGSKSPIPAHQHHQPAKSAQRVSLESAPLIQAEQSLQTEPALAQIPTDNQSGERGKRKAPALPILQPVKQALNHSSLPVLLTPAVQSSEQEPASALTPMDNQSGNLGKSKTPASPTRQRAKSQRKTGRKAVSKTKAASKNSRAKAPAQTHTDSPYSVDGH
jgi:hypothetical protein